MNDVDALLRGLDAEPGAQLTPAETGRSERLLEQITRYAPPPPDQHALDRRAHARRRARTRFALGTAGVAAAALAIGLVVGGQFLGHTRPSENGQARATPGLTVTELADWTAMPGHPAVASPVVQQAVGACLSGFSSSSRFGKFTNISDVDQRGSVITFMATAPASGTTMWCMTASGHDVTASVVNASYLPLPTVGPTAVNALEYAWGIGPGTISYALGQVGADVTGVSLKTTAGETITATVQDGFWSLWWPPNVSYSDFGGTVTWTTAGGASHTVPLTSIGAYAKKPASGNGKPSAITR